jgi:hypothetical protein
MRPEDQKRILKKLLEREQTSRKADRHLELADQLEATLFDKQRAFIFDPAKEKAAVCGRRAGKSRGTVTGMAVRGIRKPGTTYIYGGLTHKSAKQVGFDTLLRLDKQFGLGCTFNRNDLSAEFPGGSKFYAVGLEDPRAAEAIRGTVEKVEIIALDECASYGQNFRYVNEEILEPMLMDADGEMWWIGSPGAACRGPFFDLTNPKPGAAHSDVPVYHWTALDNPYIPHAADWLERRRLKKGWSLDNPIYLREYMGLWVKDEGSLVYRYDESRNWENELPPGDWSYIMGVDLGYDDPTAFVVVAYSPQSPILYVVDEFCRSKMLPSQVAEELRAWQERYKPVATVVDTGGLGKAIAEEMRSRYGVSLKRAEKDKKYEYVELINSDFFEGRIKITGGAKETASELGLLQWDEDRRKEDPRFPNHRADALLYAWRESAHWGYRAPERLVLEHSQEWWESHEQRLAKQMAEREKRPFWERLFE